MTSAQLIAISLDIGKRLLECGAETYRVEDAVSRICMAYNAVEVSVYAVPTTIIASIKMGEEAPITRVVRIHKRGTNLGQLDLLNTLCRDICNVKPDCNEIKERLHIIMRHSNYSKWAVCLATGGGAGFFTLLFGGGIAEALCSSVTGWILWGLLVWMAHIHSNTLFINVIGGCWVAAAALFYEYIGIISKYDTMIIGTIMILVPGLTLTNSIRDLIAGDFMSGITKFTEALLVAAGIAVGAALPLGLAGMVGG